MSKTFIFNSFQLLQNTKQTSNHTHLVTTLSFHSVRYLCFQTAVETLEIQLILLLNIASFS